MEEYFDEAEIARLMSVQKVLPDNWEIRLKTRLRSELSQKKAILPISTSAGEFRIIVRESLVNSLDFSVILAFVRSNGSLFRLRRYNGLHAPAGGHVNRLERQTISGYHIHQATLRYQQAGFREDAFAVASKDFTDTVSALRLMFSQCTFKIPEPEGESAERQLRLLPKKN